jgi:hypothetical protein
MVAAPSRQPSSAPVDGWSSARAAASFAATIAVNCAAEGHGDEACPIRVVAEDVARRSLAVARELADVEVAAA